MVVLTLLVTDVICLFLLVCYCSEDAAFGDWEDSCEDEDEVFEW